MHAGAGHEVTRPSPGVLARPVERRRIGWSSRLITAAVAAAGSPRFQFAARTAGLSKRFEINM
jgi:hypothetical protein